MARLEKIGAFALTEPEHGSDVVALETRARRQGDEYVIEGRKRWIGNASFADVIIVWARDEDGNVGGFVLEKGTPGFHAEIITGKASKRASWQTDIRLEDLRVPVENRLVHARIFKDTTRVLCATRYGVGLRSPARHSHGRRRGASGFRRRAEHPACCARRGGGDCIAASRAGAGGAGVGRGREHEADRGAARHQSRRTPSRRSGGGHRPERDRKY
jgi:alkylation response protein AidB-like acyl-CoA dehydrogenase